MNRSLRSLRVGRCGSALALFSLLLTLCFTSAPRSEASILTEQYRRALELDPANDDLRYQMGVALLGDGDVNGAVAALTKAYRSLGNSLEMNYNLALAYSLLPDQENAQLYLEVAETLGARENQALYPIATLWYNLALAAIEQRHDSDAESFLAKAIELAPENIVAQRLLGDRLARRGAIDEAVQRFRTCLQLDPNDRESRDYLFALHYNRAVALLNDPQGKAAARQELTAALEVNPASVMARYFQGYIDYLDGDYNQAATRLIRIATTVPDDLQPNLQAMIYNCGLNLLLAKRYVDGEKIADFLLQLPEPAVRSILLAGNFKLYLEQYAAAIELYNRILLSEPDHRDATINRLIATGKLADAEMAKGRELYADGKFREALSSFRTVLEIRSGDQLAQQYLSECQMELDRSANALFAQAEASLAGDQLIRALQLVHQGLAANPNSPRGRELEKTLLSRLTLEIESRIAAAEGLVAAGAWSDAESAYRSVGELSPENVAVAAGLEKISRLRGERFTLILARFQTALTEERLTDAKGLLQEMAATQPESDRLKTAEADLTAAIEHTVERLVRLGRAAFAEKRVKDGRNLFQRALTLRDDAALQKELAALELKYDSQLATLLASLYKAIDKRDFKTARAYLTQAENLAPTEVQVFQGRKDLEAALKQTISTLTSSAATAVGKKNWRNAISDYRRILDLDPTHAGALQGVRDAKGQLQNDLVKLTASGTAQFKSGDLTRAEESFRQALSIDPYDPTAREGLDKITQARSIGAKPGDENALYLKGIDLYTRGRYEESIKVWETVLKLDPKHDKARTNIDKAQKKLQQIKEYRNG